MYRGRVSIARARYFVTLCVKGRQKNLLGKDVADTISGVWKLQEADDDYTLECATLMPDHLHLLCTLGNRLTLGQCIAKFKAKTKEALRSAGLEWQRDFYEHRLRVDDAMERFARYIYMNPYRRSLLRCEAGWSHWHLSKQYKPEFLLHLNAAGGPPEAWLSDAGMGIEDLIEMDAVREGLRES